MITLSSGPAGTYILDHDDGGSILFQVDYEYISLVQMLGLDPDNVLDESDPSSIDKAREILDDNIDEEFDDIEELMEYFVKDKNEY